MKQHRPYGEAASDTDEADVARWEGAASASSRLRGWGVTTAALIGISLAAVVLVWLFLRGSVPPPWDGGWC